MSSTATHCPYCALQCGMNLVSKDGELSVVARPEFPTNKGGLCSKGWTSTALIGHPDRLTSPLMRGSKDAPLEPVSWDRALSAISDQIQRIQAEHGKDAIGVFGGGGLTNEKAYMLGKFARVALRTSNIDYNGRFCMSTAASAGIMAFGLDRGLPFPLEDIPHAETILLIGSNLAETMPPAMQYLEAQRANGGNLIVLDPRLTPTAAAATLHLQLTPGTDAALANGLLHIAQSEGLLDLEFIANRTQGFEAVQRTIASYWPDRVERITGVPIPQLKRAAGLLGDAKTAMVLTSRGVEQQSKGVDNVLAFINLILALGKAGKSHCGYGCITGQGNGQGGREHGQKADQLPGYRRIDNPQHRAHIAKVWGVDETDLPGKGKSAYELLDSLGTEEGARALLVMGSNPAVSAPNAGHIQERLKALDLLVVSDIFLSETAAIADVVLPTTQWAEEEGTMTNLEGRVLLRRKATESPPGIRSDLQILQGIAQRLGYGGFFTDSAPEVFEELRRASAGGIADYSGISYERIAKEDGVFWPCPSLDHPGTPRMFPRKICNGEWSSEISSWSPTDLRRRRAGTITIRYSSQPVESWRSTSRGRKPAGSKHSNKRPPSRLSRFTRPSPKPTTSAKASPFGLKRDAARSASKPELPSRSAKTPYSPRFTGAVRVARIFSPTQPSIPHQRCPSSRFVPLAWRPTLLSDTRLTTTPHQEENHETNRS